MPSPVLTGLSEIASDYDALICDIWGVVHNGATAYLPACEALKNFRAEFGPVILLSNAPRPVADVEAMFERFGVPADCYDAIVTSGVAAREDLARRSATARLKMLHLGPERDRGVFAGLDIDCTDAEHAEIVLCTGPYDDEKETPGDYAAMFADLKSRGLTMLCANPDQVVQRGGRLIYCAGALARAYEKIGGAVVYYGKPHAPIYPMTLAAAAGIARRPVKRPLAIGDGIETDVKGANAAGIDVLFIADGIHGEEIGEVTPASIAALLEKSGAHARAAMRALVW